MTIHRPIRVTATLATLLALCTPARAVDRPLPVYGGPTYSPSAGGYMAETLENGLYPSAHVNNAGTAVASPFRWGNSGTELGYRAVRWSAGSAAIELGGNPNASSPNSMSAEGINNTGTVIGSALVWEDSPRPGYQFRPARWAASGTEATILQHPHVANESFYAFASFLFDINDAGNAVGVVFKTVYDSFGTPVDRGTRAGRWNTSSAALTELGHLGTAGDGYTQAQANAVNATGVTVGYAQKFDAAGTYFGYRAVKWDASGVVAIELDHLGTSAPTIPGDPGGFAEGRAFAINSAGTAVGFADVYDNSGQRLKYHAPVRWDASGAPTELGTLGALAGGMFSSPAVLNDAGTAVGWASLAGTRAVRWEASSTAATELGNLGTHESGIGYSEAWAVNAFGTAVGWAEKWNAAGTSLSGKRAVYWGADTLAIDLNTLIDPASGWLLTHALEISDSGWIVGEGYFDPDGPGGQDAYSRHFLMQVPATVPEPSALALLALSLPLLVVRRQRQALDPSSELPPE